MIAPHLGNEFVAGGRSGAQKNFSMALGAVASSGLPRSTIDIDVVHPNYTQRLNFRAVVLLPNRRESECLQGRWYHGTRRLGGPAVRITIVTSRELSHNTARAKEATQAGPVFITDRGRPTHVLLSIEQYRVLSAPAMSLAQAVAMPESEETDLAARV